jgi:hypothetical protein
VRLRGKLIRGLEMGDRLLLSLTKAQIVDDGDEDEDESDGCCYSL